MFEMSNALHHNASYKQSLSYACGCMCVGALPGTHVNMCANPVSPYFTTRNKKNIYIYMSIKPKYLLLLMRSTGLGEPQMV